MISFNIFGRFDTMLSHIYAMGLVAMARNHAVMIVKRVSFC